MQLLWPTAHFWIPQIVLLNIENKLCLIKFHAMQQYIPCASRHNS